MGKTRAPRKKKEVVEATPQVVELKKVKEPPPPPPPLTEEEKELVAVRERCAKESIEAEKAYNRDVLPGKMKKLKEALKKLPKKCSTEELLKAAFDALSEGNPDVGTW